MNAAGIRQALSCGRPGCACARSRNTHCPGSAHTNNDADPSLTVDDKNGTVLWHCKRGCSQEEISRALKDRNLLQLDNAPTPMRRAERLVKEYEFRDVTGALQAVHGRFETIEGKTFRWRTPDGEWKDGLGFPESNLPVYNLAAVLESPEARVWFVEGEKAADACAAQGLIAVSLPGGASQQRFGNALDPLLERDVILWADNDEAGRALMQRVAGYLPNARTVSPAVAPKGDAHDYFAAGATVDALLELLKSNAPVVRVVSEDGVHVEFPVSGGVLTFTFSDFSISGTTIRTALHVYSSLPGQGGLPYSSDLNLGSPSAREGVRREIEQFFGQSGKESPWTRALSFACSSAGDAWLNIDHSVDLRNVDSPPERLFLVERTIPYGVGSILFGMGGHGKSYVGGDILAHVLHGRAWQGRGVMQQEAVGVLDFEDSQEEWKLRIQELCLGAGLPFDERVFRYIPGRGVPLYEQRQRLFRMIEEHHLGALLIDSAASASGGDLLEVGAAAKLTSTLTEFGRRGCTSLLIAHNTKAQDSQYPYGNIMWHNLVRSTHYIEAVQDEGSLVLDALIHNRKSNRGKQRPISVRMTFPEASGGAVVIAPHDITANEVERSKRDGDQIPMLLDLIRSAGGQESTTRLAHQSRLKPEQVRTLMGRLVERGQVMRTGQKAGDGSTMWALATGRVDNEWGAQQVSATGQAQQLANVADLDSRNSSATANDSVLRGATQHTPPIGGAVAPVAPVPSDKEEEERIDSLAGG